VLFPVPDEAHARSRNRLLHSDIRTMIRDSGGVVSSSHGALTRMGRPERPPRCPTRLGLKPGTAERRGPGTVGTGPGPTLQSGKAIPPVVPSCSHVCGG